MKRSIEKSKLNTTAGCFVQQPNSEQSVEEGDATEAQSELPQLETKK